MKSDVNWWRTLTRAAIVMAALGTVRLAAIASIGTDLDCLSSLTACWPGVNCSTTGDPRPTDYCCIGYSSNRTRVCCQYQGCTEWADCQGGGCIRGVSQPIASNGPGTEHPNKNCVNGRCQ